MLQAFRQGDNTYGFQFHPQCTPENFKRRQVSGFGVYGRLGDQAKEQQDELGARYDSIQATWLQDFLTNLVGPSS